MRKLFYNIYSNISDKSFLKMDKKLNVLQYKMSKILFVENWRLPNSEDKGDALYIAFLKKDKIFSGNIGIVFEDHPSDATTFYLGVLKSFEDGAYHYSFLKKIFEKKEIQFFEDNISDVTKMALEAYNSWTKEDIMTLGTADTMT